MTKSINATKWIRWLRDEIVVHGKDGGSIIGQRCYVWTPAHGDEWWSVLDAHTGENVIRIDMEGRCNNWRIPIFLPKRSEASKERDRRRKAMERQLVKAGLPACSWRKQEARCAAR